MPNDVQFGLLEVFLSEGRDQDGRATKFNVRRLVLHEIELEVDGAADNKPVGSGQRKLSGGDLVMQGENARGKEGGVSLVAALQVVDVQTVSLQLLLVHRPFFQNLKTKYTSQCVCTAPISFLGRTLE